MIVVITGFPTHKEGLSFEWACLIRFQLLYSGQHPTRSAVCRKFISPTLGRKRTYVSRIEIAFQMLVHSPWREMELSVIITNYDVYSQIQTKLSSLASRVTIMNQPLQYLYDHEMADETLVDDNSESQTNILINTLFSNEEDNYLPNAYCQSFNVILIVF